MAASVLVPPTTVKNSKKSPAFRGRAGPRPEQPSRAGLSRSRSRAEPGWAEPSRAEPSRADPGQAETAPEGPRRPQDHPPKPIFSHRHFFANMLFRIHETPTLWPGRGKPSRAAPSAKWSRAEPSRAGPSRAGGEARRGEPARAGPSQAKPSQADPSRAEPSQSGPETGRDGPRTTLQNQFLATVIAPSFFTKSKEGPNRTLPHAIVY